MSDKHGRGPDVRFPPPFLFVAGFIVGWIADRYVSHIWPPLPSGVAQTVEALGWVLIVAGLLWSAWGIVTFTRIRTAVYPNRDASSLVIEGPYRFTRNPMYLGMALSYVGLALVARTLWPVVLLPLVLYGLYLMVIAREERYLTAAFGDAYREYQRRVGRWVG